MLKSSYPYYLANVAEQPNTDLEVTDKYTGKVATRVALADARAIDAGIAAAVAAAEAMREFAPYQRQAVLEHCVKRFRERFEPLCGAGAVVCLHSGMTPAQRLSSWLAILRAIPSRAVAL